MDIPLNEVLYFDCITLSPSTSVPVTADANPTFGVYEEDNDVPIVTGSFSARVGLNGNYRSSVTISIANGFEIGKWYTIIGSATVATIPGRAVLYSFRVVAAESIVGVSGVTLFPGYGPFVVTITVTTNLAVPIQGANVSLYRVGDERHGITDVNGIVVFNSDAVTWTSVAISAIGYIWPIASLVVAANTSVTYAGALNGVIQAPLSAAQVHVQAYVYDEYGAVEAGATISVQMVCPYTTTGIYDKKIATFASNQAGVVTMTNLFQGATYNIWRGRSTPMKYVVPITIAAMVNCDPILGDDSTDTCL